MGLGLAFDFLGEPKGGSDAENEEDGKDDKRGFCSFGHDGVEMGGLMEEKVGGGDDNRKGRLVGRPLV